MRFKVIMLNKMILSLILLIGLGVSNQIFAQQKLIQGKVIGSEGSPLPGVTVLVKGKAVGTVTDSDGNFSLQVPADAETLVFSFIGMITQEIPVAGQTTFNITMQEDVYGIEEVVAIGYGTIKKADLTGSVATVSSEEIKKNSYSNVMQGLQGKIPGVYVTSDGNPSGSVNIQIRGITSMRSAPPLIVVDDLPTTLNLRDINPNDIKSIQVLKDAASASIYGSRAASGVIIIETNKGKTGETKISYDAMFGVSNLMNRLDMMNTQEYGATLWRGAINDGQNPNLSTQIYHYSWHYDESGNPVLDKVAPRQWLNAAKTMRSADTDWFEEGTQLGLQNNHNITVSNGTDKAKTLFSLSYYENEGTQIHTMFRRYAIRLNSEYDLIKDRLTVGENISISNIKYNSQNQTNNLLTMPSIIPVYTNDGEWGGTAYAFGMDHYSNPVRELTMAKDNYRFTNKIVGSVYAKLQLFKNLNLKTLYGIDNSDHKFRHIGFSYEEGGGKLDPNNGIRSYRSEGTSRTWTNTLNYDLQINNHSLNVLAGMEILKYYSENVNAFRRDIELENYDYAYLSSAIGNTDVSGTGNEYALLSYFSKLNYVHSSKYLLSLTLRYDGSSKFGKNNQFGFFPSVSGGWRLSEESFLKNNAIISNLKLRASWGMNGNSNIPTDALVDYYDANYEFTSYALAGNESGNLASGYRRRHTGNPDLKWEATRQTDIGIDFGLFNGTLSGSVDYFLKYTDGMLYRPNYIAAIGEGGYHWINAANMTNNGIEGIITYASKKKNDFSYTVTANISSFKNKIQDLPEEVKYTYGGNGLDDDILGRPLRSIYGFVADGLFQSQDEVDNSPEQPGKGLGRIKYKDLDGDGRITWEHDRTWIGVTDPDFMYGINFNAQYKKFDFSMFWQGIVGNTVRNDWKSYSDFWNVWTQKGFNHSTRLLDAWTPENSDSDIPAVSLINQNDERRVSTYFMESGSYLKLRDIELGYSLPKGVEKIGMKHLRVYLKAQNIVNLKKWWGEDAYTGVDPENPSKAAEYSSPYVRPQVFLVGVNVSF